MESRHACTSGGIAIVTSDGRVRSIPAGKCWIRRRTLDQGHVTIGWTEQGIDYSAPISDQHLRRYLNGCMLQYTH